MFTGLIQDVGTLESVQKRSGGATLQIRTGLPTGDFALGESVAVEGVCLTVTAVSGAVFHADCSPETLRRTTLGDKKPGARLHLERALRLGDRLGGHIVSGHVDGLARIQSVTPEGNAILVTLELPPSLLRYTIEKGSIAIDGVSLTINTLQGNTLSVAIIPHTQEWTHTGTYQPGDAVNIEVDMVGKYIERMTQPWHDAASPTSGIDEEFLKKHGFA